MQTANLIANPAAEAGLSGWSTSEGSAVVIAYGASGYPGPSSPGPADRGANFFGGGTSPRTRLHQSITLPLVAEIDAGAARFTFSGWLGGYAGQDDGVRLSMEFLDPAGRPTGVVVLGPVTAGERGSVTGLWLRSSAGVVPPGSRTARVLMLFTREGGASNDGYADSLSLVLHTSGVNLVANPGAESGLTGWTVAEGAPAVIVYGAPGYPTLTGPGPADRGARFFTGGTVARSRLAQRVTLPAGNRYDIECWLGGWENQKDNARLTVVFRSAAGQALGTVVLGPVTNADRGNVTGLWRRTATGAVPAGSVAADLELLFTRTGGNANDGYADAISLSIQGSL